MHRRLVPLALSLILAAAAEAEPWTRPRDADALKQQGLLSTAEESGFKRTGRYAEVERLCQAYAARFQAQVSCEEFGTTPEGRSMKALVVTRSGARTPEEARRRGVPVVLMQGGIHAGEIDGKDAGFVALRRLLLQPDGLDKVVFVFVPVFNIDGHERFGRWNRPNQVGPEEMGWRVTGQNLNLNRDYAKADAPEMEAMLRLLNRWDPILYVDLHVTDGAKFQPDVATLVEPIFIGDPGLQPLGKKFQSDLNALLKGDGASPLAFYPSFRKADDPASGFADSGYMARFSTGYWPLHNRLAMLVETHSWKDYATRVRITHDAIVRSLELAARDGKQWLSAAHQADGRSLAGQPVTLETRTTDKHTDIEFPGYAYSRTASTVSGAQALHYDDTRPEVWRVPFYNEVVPKLQVTAPRGGYVIAAAHADEMARRLTIHGVVCRRLTGAASSVPVEVFRATAAEPAPKSYEGRQPMELTGAWSPETATLEAGSLFVPIAQPNARLAMALLEPLAPDSYAAWGFFNAHFEQREYMEDYVAEDVGAEMLANNPQVAEEFRRRLASDPKFAADPAARLEFFYRHHGSWDQKFNLLPIVRTARTF